MSTEEDEYEAYRCVGCRQYLVNDAYQCTCGDRLCEFCFNISSYSVNTFECRYCGEEVIVNNCFRDKASVAYLKEAVLPCTSFGCSWRGPSEKYLPHLETCGHALVECPYQIYGCTTKIGRRHVSTHKDICSYKHTKCEYCKRLIQDEKKHLELECNSVLLDCKNGCGATVLRDEMDNHMLTVCKYKAENSQFSCTRHQENMGNAEDIEKFNDFSILAQVRSTKTNLIQLRYSMESNLSLLQQQVMEMKKELNQINEQVVARSQLYATSVNKIKNSIHNIQEGSEKLTTVLSCLNESTYDGTFTWVIPEVRRHRHEAMTEKMLFIYSAPFFTSRIGYKLCLRLYLNGDGIGKSSHISLFLVIMKGEYDALLEWPFRHATSLSLLNQDGGNNISHNIEPVATSWSFERPQKEMNVPYGNPKFAPQSVFRDASYVKDNSMYIRCVIDTSTITHP